MAKITVLGRTRIGGEQPCGDVVWENGKIVPCLLVIKDAPIATADITYYLRYTRNKKQTIENVGTNLADVYQRRRVIEATLAAESNGLVVTNGSLYRINSVEHSEVFGVGKDATQ